jgi:hypothetical protein
MVSLVNGHEVDDTADLAIEAGRSRGRRLKKQILWDVFKSGGESVSGLAPGANQKFRRRISGILHQLLAAPEAFKPGLRHFGAHKVQEPATAKRHVPNDPRDVIHIVARTLQPLLGREVTDSLLQKPRVEAIVFCGGCYDSGYRHGTS